MNLRAVASWLLCVWTTMAHAQDPSFSQIENTRLYTHSSDMVVYCGIEFEAAHRSQWSAIPGGFTTSFVSCFYQSGIMRSGIGIKYLQDSEGSGSFKTEDIKLVYRYNVFRHSYYNPRRLCLALESGLVRKSIDWSRLVFSDQLDPVFGIYKNTSLLVYNQDPVSFFDVTLSGTYKDKIKIHGINRPYTASASWRHMAFDRDESLLRLGKRLPGVLTITLASSFTPIQYYKLPLFKPTLRFEIQNNIKRLVYGSLVGIASDEKKQTLYTGLFYSSQYNPISEFNSNGLIFLMGVEKLIRHTRCSFAYSYDMTTSGLGNATTTGAHEFTLNIYLDRCTSEFDQPSNIFNTCPQ